MKKEGNKGVLTVLSGMTYMEHLQDNVRTYSPLEPCTDEELALLEDTAQMILRYPSVPCTACQYCMPCPTASTSPASSPTTTSASTKATCRHPRRTRTTARHAALSSSATTGEFPVCVRQAIASVATNANLIARKASRYPMRCSASTALWNN